MMFSNYIYVLTAVVSSLLVFIMACLAKEAYRKNERRLEQINNFFDALGLGAFTITGVRAAMEMDYGGNMFLAVALGVVTGIGGGLLRDCMIQEISMVFTKRIYALASLAGGYVYYLLASAQLNDTFAVFSSIAVIFAIRVCATVFKWSLPKAL